MASRTVDIDEAKTQLSRLIERVLDGEEVVIAKGNKPVVRLVKWQPDPERVPGLWAGKIHIRYDFDEFTANDESDWYGHSD